MNNSNGPDFNNNNNNNVVASPRLLFTDFNGKFKARLSAVIPAHVSPGSGGDSYCKTIWSSWYTHRRRMNTSKIRGRRLQHDSRQAGISEVMETIVCQECIREGLGLVSVRLWLWECMWFRSTHSHRDLGNFRMVKRIYLSILAWQLVIFLNSNIWSMPKNCLIDCLFCFWLLSDKIKINGSNLYGISTYSLKILFISFFYILLSSENL